MPSPKIANYTFLKRQGSGTFGSVYQGEWDGRLSCAIKIFDKAAINAAYVSWCLEKLRGEERHPHVIPVLGFDLAQNPAYASSSWMEPPANGLRSFTDAAGKWSLQETGAGLVSLAGSLAWLHERGVIHTGLTSGNVLLLSESPDSACLTDVGQGLIDSNQEADWTAHAPYLSPERCRHEPPQGESSGEAWDVYAFGVVAFQLLTGRNHVRALDYFKKINKVRPNQTSPPRIDLAELAAHLEKDLDVAWRSRPNSPSEEALRALVDRCLALSLDKRFLHMADVLKALRKIDLDALHPELRTLTPRPASQSVRGVRPPPRVEKKPPPAKPPLSLKLKDTWQKAQVLAKRLPRPKLTSKFSLPSSSGLTLAGGAAAVLAASLAGWQYRQHQQACSEVAHLQAALAHSRTAAETQSAELQTQANLAKQALAEQARLRLNLQHEQDMGDSLLETLLEQRPNNERDLEIWKARLTDYSVQAADRLKQMSDNPNLKEASARTRWNMASLTLALNEPQAAIGWLNDALSEVELSAAATTDKTQHAAWDLLSGKIQSRRGELSLQRGLTAEATQRLGQAVQGLQGYLQAAPSDNAGLRELARAQWLLGKALLAKPDPAAANEHLSAASEAATKLIFSDARRDSDVFLLVDSYHGQAQAYLALKQEDNALKSYFQPMQALRDWDRDNPTAEAGRSRLAASYLGMGRLLANLPEEANPAGKSLNQGIRVLLDLITEHSDNETYLLDLGDAYAELANLAVAAAGSARDGIPHIASAVNYLQILVEKNHAEPHYRVRYATALARQTELFSQVSKFSDAVKTGPIAETLLDALEHEEGLSPEDQAAALHTSASLQAILGRCWEQLAKLPQAKEAYRKAIVLGENICALNPQDEAAQQALTAAQVHAKRLEK